MMGNRKFNDQWKIKMESGQIKGPFPTESINKMIVEGILSGQEEVSLHPSQDWRPLSKVPDFYEALLESLENPTERDEKKAQKMDAETVIQTIEPKVSEPDDAEESIAPELKNEFKQLIEDERKKPTFPVATPAALKPVISNSPSQTSQKMQSTSLLEARDQQLTIEMQQLKNIQSRESKKFFPFIILILGVAAALYYFLSSPVQKPTGWILIAPNKNAEPTALTAAELKSLKTKAISLIRSGTLENVKDSQKFLVQAIESSSNDIETLGLLCVVYEQLWPYTKQTSNDFKAIATVTQMSRAISSISNYSNTCQSVYLLTKGQPKDARGLIEKTLDQQVDNKFILGPFLYLMKGQLLEELQNHISAEAYYAEAVKNFPGWNWALFAQARSLYKQAKYNEAKDAYINILRTNPEYKGALFGLGLIELKIPSANDKALNYFNKAYAISGKLPKIFHLEALQEYIQLLVTRKDNKKALEVAQFALAISPSHSVIREILLSLGGEDRGNNQSAELTFLGDQFARSGDHLAAQAQYRTAFDLDKTNAESALKAAKSLWAINQTRGALTWVDRAIAADRKMSLAYAQKADYLSQKFSFAEATKTLHDALKLGGQNFDVIKTQALVEYRKNSMATTIAYGEKALKLYDADVELLSLLANANINLYLNSPSRDKEEGLKKVKYLEDAQRYAGKAVDLEPGKPDAQIVYAKYLYIKPSAGNSNVTAENYLKKMIETFPYTVEYHIGLADFYELQEKYKSASEIYLQLVQADPKNKKALMGLARSYQQMNDIKNAQKYFMEAALLDPSDVEPIFATGQLELDNPDTKNFTAVIQSAYKKFELVKRINPGYPRISYFIARCHLELGEFDRALEMIKEEKNKNPSIADPYLLAASVYDAQKKYKECAAEYSQGIKLRPNATSLYVSAAICYRKSDSLDIAMDMLEIAQQRESGFAPIYRELGYLIERGSGSSVIKTCTTATSCFQLYLELSPNAMDRKEIEAKLGL